MLKENQVIETKWNSTTKKYYEEKGYEYTGMFTPLIVRVEDLPVHSHSKVIVICDYCGKEYTKRYKDYFSQHINGDCCKDCLQIKAKAQFEEKYGVPANEYMKERFIEKHGDINPMNVEGAKEKLAETNIKKYGAKTVLVLPENREKMLEGIHDPKTMEKRINTNLEKYGYKFGLSSPEVREKISESYYSHGTKIASKQQIELFNLINSVYGNCELNYPCERYSLDCMAVIDGVKYDIEYDGKYWHDMYGERDGLRNEKVINNGYKVLRIVSNYNVPTESQLKEYIDILSKKEDNLLVINL